MKKNTMFCAAVLALALAVAGCEKNVKPDPIPAVTVDTSVVCTEKALPGLELEPVEFTFVDGSEVSLVPVRSSFVRPEPTRWVAMTNDNWGRLMRNQNKIVKHTGSLMAVLDYYADCINAAQGESK